MQAELLTGAQRNVRYFGPANSYEEAIARLVSHRGKIAVDTETIALKGDKSVNYDDWDEDGNLMSKKALMDARTIIGIGVAIGPSEGFYFPLGRPGWRNVPISDPYPLVSLLERGAEVHFFNSMFDLDRIEEGLGVEITNFHDVAIACQVQGLWNALDANSTQLLGEWHTIIDDVLPKGKTMLDVEFLTTADKCIADCFTTFKLSEMMDLEHWSTRGEFVWQDHISRQFDVTCEIKDCYETDRRLVPILRKMSKRGFKINPKRVKYWGDKLQHEMRQYDEFFQYHGVNPQSNNQVAKFLISRGNYLPFTEGSRGKEKKNYKVNDEILHNVKDPVGYMVLSRRRRQKLFGTYVKPFGIWDEYGRFIDAPERAYTHFRLDLATGRLGSYDFNSQNLPPQMRGIFDPDTGRFMWADLHQAEMRVWANQAKDEVMLKEFAEGRSPHDATLKALFPGKPKKIYTGRKVLDQYGNEIDESYSSDYYVSAKSYNFALLADASAAVLARTTKQSVQDCQHYKDELYKLYWKSKLHQDYMRQRHTPWHMPDYVEDDYGRRCHIPDTSPFVDETHQQKCRLNYPFQATVAGVVKRQMIGLDQSGFNLAGQVHDEHLQDGYLEFPKWMSQVHPEIEMPFEVDGGAQWI